MENSQQNLDEIAGRARELGPRERYAFVHEACEGDPTLISRVYAVLQSETGEVPWEDLEIDAEPAVVSRVGQRLGPYRIVRSLGVGGMGEVYLAERADDEYQQQVAIKLVHAGTLSPQVQTRLRTERQILASLKHPHIAQLLDGGTTPDGTPYLVLEYIEGLPIDVYCDRHRLGITERLQLFRMVCSAVHCAHQNLIVHRDLKPSNILVTAAGAPKLLDFGIAKLLDDSRALRTVAVTHHDIRVMTPSHASPEQVRGEAITTASDIYVLGTLLYELLCGRRTFSMPPGRRLADIERLVCDTNPPAPSTAVARARREEPAFMEELAACRGATTLKLERQLKGDLDNLVLMALRKEPGRRYASVEQFSTDIERYMSGHPILATRDEWNYRTRKFLKRHAWSSAATAGAAVILIAFSAVTYLQAQSIARQRDAAAAERARAEQVSGFLVDLFELSDPSRSRGNELKARELLDIGARRIDSGLVDQPAARSLMLGTIGRVYDGLGLYNDAATALEKALQLRIQLYGPQHAEVADALLSLGQVLIAQGRLDEADARLAQALQLRTRLFGTDALELAPVLKLQGRLAMERGDFRAAEMKYRDCLKRYEEHGLRDDSRVAAALTELGSLLANTYQDAEAEAHFRRALAIDRQALGEDHPQVAEALGNLADALEGQGKYAEALPLFEQALSLKRRVLGAEHPLTIDGMENFGNFLRRKGDYAAAEQVLQTALQANRRVRGEQHAYVGYDHVNLGLLYYDQRRHHEAEREFRAGLRIYAQALPADHIYVAGALIGLGRALTQQARINDALPLLERALDISSRTMGTDNPFTHTARAALGIALAKTHRRAEARALLEQAQGAVLQTYGETAVISREMAEALQIVANDTRAAQLPRNSL